MATSEAVRCPAAGRACGSGSSSLRAALRPSLLQNLAQRAIVRCRPVQVKVSAQQWVFVLPSGWGDGSAPLPKTTYRGCLDHRDRSFTPVSPPPPRLSTAGPHRCRRHPYRAVRADGSGPAGRVRLLLQMD